MIGRLEFGARRALHLREESVGDRFGLRLLYVSDLHLTPRRRFLVDELARVACAARPDAILLGGDLVDRVRGLPVLTTAIGRLIRIAPVHAIPGNHDAYVGLDAVRTAVALGGGNWLPDEPVRMGDVVLCGTTDAPYVEGTSVLCTHDPAIWDEARAAGHRVVLAGHLHGGQCVLWQRAGRLYPGAWFNRLTALRLEAEASTLIVSRGAADSLPVRWNCPREAVLCLL